MLSVLAMPAGGCTGDVPVPVDAGPSVAAPMSSPVTTGTVSPREALLDTSPSSVVATFLGGGDECGFTARTCCGFFGDDGDYGFGSRAFLDRCAFLGGHDDHSSTRRTVKGADAASRRGCSRPCPPEPGRARRPR